MLFAFASAKLLLFPEMRKLKLQKLSIFLQQLFKIGTRIIKNRLFGDVDLLKNIKNSKFANNLN